MAKRPDSNDLNSVIRVDFKNQSGFVKKSLRQPRMVSLDQDKLNLFQEWLDAGIVCLLFDARQSGVLVPQEFVWQGDLRLNFCYQFHVPDFVFDENSVRCTLLFDSGEFFCQVPWRAVYGMQSQSLSQGAVWFEDFPHDYDQKSVLGFSERTCAEKASDQDQDNVIAWDFSK